MAYVVMRHRCEDFFTGDTTSTPIHVYLRDRSAADAHAYGLTHDPNRDADNWFDVVYVEDDIVDHG